MEVIIEREMKNSDLVKMLKNSPIVPIFTILPTSKCFSFVKTCTFLENYFGDNMDEWPDVLQKYQLDDKDLGFNALGMSIAFLIDAMIAEQTMKLGIYTEYVP